MKNQNNMPTRIIREGIITSESVNSLSDEAELFYRRAMSVVDDYGRYYSHPSLLRAACYPFKLDKVSEADVKRFLNECVSKSLIAIFGGGKYIQFFNFRQQTRSKSKFPEPTENELLIKLKAEPKQMSSLVGVGVGDGDENEVADVESCIAMTMTAGIPENFVRYVYADWFARSGKDASGVVVRWLPYITKRWVRESVEWRNGRHKGISEKEKSANKRPTHIPDAVMTP